MLIKLPLSIRLKKPWRISSRITLRKALVATCISITLCITLNKTYELTQYTFLAYAHIPSQTLSKNRSLPTFIHIPSLEISLPIDETSSSSFFWKTNIDTASHLSSSAIPGEPSNTVLYAQNTTQAFGRLTSLQKGDSILVTTQNGDTYEYQVEKLTVVSPTEVDYISNTDKEALTLYTSYGFGSLKRFVVKSLPVSL